MNNHPYIKYAQALLMCNNDLTSLEDIKISHLIAEIDNGLNHFSNKSVEDYNNKKKVHYIFSREKNDAKKYIFLAPNVITNEMQAKNIWKAAIEYINNIKDKDESFLSKVVNIGMSEVPITGEFLSFSDNANIGRGNPKASVMEQGLGLITSLTIEKPCSQYRIDKKDRPELFNVCIIPDLSINKMITFIRLFKQMKATQASNLLIGDVISKTNGKRGEKTITYVPKRPLIFNGNFPNSPKSSALGNIALLGAIGEFSKNAEYSELAKQVLNNLKETTMYMIKYGNASTFTYNNHVIDLAKDGKLRTIIDSLYYSQLYNQDKRASKNTEYQKFDLFTSRFLQLFTPAAFRDFMAFRAEYPAPIETLLNTYFTKMEKIDPNIVVSAKQLGKWLNLVAYFAAKLEIKEGTVNYWDEIRKIKAKVLIELESSTFAAKTGDALIAQVITRAGRLSGMDAPATASLYMEKTASGELALENAKNLLIAFSRLKNQPQSSEQSEGFSDEIDDNNEIKNFSNE